MYIWKYKIVTNNIYTNLFVTNEKKKSFKLLSMKFLILVYPTTICLIIIIIIIIIIPLFVCVYI